MEPMRVLLATDGSSEARQAAVWLRDLALPPDTVVCVVVVATLTEPPRDSRSLTALRETLRTEAGEAGERAAAILKARWPQVETVIAEGDAVVEILHVTEQNRSDMAVLGARGLGRVKRFLGGSTSLAVARYAPCPVAVVQGRPRPLERVLVAVDGSAASRAAVEFLARFDLAADTRVLLLHVLPESPVPGVRRSTKSGGGESASVSLRNERADAEQCLADAGTVLADLPCSVEPMVAGGDPAREIVRVARKHDVDLVVLGARGLRTLGRLLLGSVSEAVLHHAGRAVMIVRER